MKKLLRVAFENIEDVFDSVFGAKWNPFYQLGALGWFYYWIVVISGIYLYIFFDTGITDAYQSLEYLTYEQWYAGGIMRSLHRYASDALVVMVIIHLLREFSMDRYRSSRWFAWFTGVPMLWFIFSAGITGYWMVWDELAQYIAIVTTEWLDTLPIFGEAIARNFISDATLSGRFFTLMVFMHIALPLFLLFIMWIHIHRHTLPRVNPPLELAGGTFLMLLVLSFAKPALSHAPANLEIVPAVINLDWFYMVIYPALDVVPGLTMWIILISATFLLMLVPWMPPGQKLPVAVVNLENCNGCSRCAADCPFNAITMMPRSDGSAYEQEAVVDEIHCTSCGICAGACPTATPFRRRTELTPGIELPDQSIKKLRENTIAATENLSGTDRVIVYGCQNSLDPVRMVGSEVGVVTMPCIGMLPPSFIDFVLSKKLADGVFLTGCREGDCCFRQGIRWTDERLARQRDPHLRQRVVQERIGKYWAGLTRSKEFFNQLNLFRTRLQKIEPSKAEESYRGAGSKYNQDNTNA